MSHAIPFVLAPFTGGTSLIPGALSALTPKMPGMPTMPTADNAALKAEEAKAQQLRDRAKRNSVLFGQSGESSTAPTYVPSLLGSGTGRSTLG